MPATPAAEYRPPESPVDFVPAAVPEDLDPLKDGILMAHQRTWLEDRSDLKLAEKGRRTGITFAEALDSTLTAAAARSAGGDNVWYIGDTKEKGREFIQTCAHFARMVAGELLGVDEYLFEDVQADGSSKWITAWRIRFASGFQIAALSSRPANIRGLQGIVVIDEAAFHPDVRGVIDACNALLIWGGKIRIISTHNGVANPFNQLIKETREGRYDYSIHRITFDDAVANGLYERVCLIKGETATPEGKAAWYRKIRRAYGSRIDAMKEELDAIPREGDGITLPMAWIEACQVPDYKVARWSPPPPDHRGEFVDWPEADRIAEMARFLAAEVDPMLDALPKRFPHALGEDFAMRHDRSAIAIGYTDQLLARHVPLIVELHRCPYAQQKQALYHIARRLPRFQGGILDANGSGMALAQEARQEFGAGRIVELIATDSWYRENTVPFVRAFEERTIYLPADIDVRDDLMQFRTINGVSKIPREVRTVGTDDGQRHADSAVALLNFYAASRMDVTEYGYLPAAPAGSGGGGDDDDDEGATGARFGQGAW